MNRNLPPPFLRSALLCVTADRSRETIDGDLIEAYADRRAASGASSANVWYARQVFSLALHAFPAQQKTALALMLLCGFTALCGAWLGTMDILLRHSNLLQHETIASLIVGQALLTLIALPFRRWAPLKGFALLGTLAVSCLGVRALWFTLRGADTEGYILIIATLLLVQSALTWQVLTQPPGVRPG